MGFPNIFKLEKLKIEAFSDAKRSSSVGEFEASFNPETISQTYETRYDVRKGAADGLQSADFLNAKPASLSLKLLLDGSGVEDMGIVSLIGSTPSVGKQIDAFVQLAYQVHGQTHEPNYLVVRWGSFLTFNGRLRKLDIVYTSFDRDGSPLRAELDIDLVADGELKRQLTGNPLSSPDVTHSRIVVAGDTLPLMTRAIYGTSALHVQVARANRLDHFRTLDPGRELLFPPIAKRASRTR